MIWIQIDSQYRERDRKGKSNFRPKPKAKPGLARPRGARGSPQKKKVPRVGNEVGKVREFLSKIAPIQILALIPGRQAKFTKLGKKIRKRYTKWH